MSNLATTCIMCGSEEELNTSTEVKHTDGKPYSVQICTDCEDDASPKAIKAKLTDKFDKYHALIAQAKEMGIVLKLDDLVKKEGGLVVAAPIQIQPPIAPVPQFQGAKPGAERLVGEDGGKMPEIMRKKEMQIFDANLDGQGRAIAIPKKTVSNAGTMYYNVNKVSDADLQKRFKNQAARSMNPRGGGAADPSTYKQCLTCNGEGTSKTGKNGKKLAICKECDGLGMIP